MFRSRTGTAILAAALGLGTTAHAGPILEQNEMDENVSSQTVNDIKIEAFRDLGEDTDGTFDRKTVGSGQTKATGIGIQNGTDGEVGFPAAQAMVFDFTRRPGGAIDLAHLQISFLYPDGEFNDDGNEVADIKVSNEKSMQTLSVEATNTTEAMLTGGSGSNVTNLEKAEQPDGGGLWQIEFSNDDAFDGVTEMVLRSGDQGSSSQAADFSFVQVAKVPVPASLVLLGTSLIGLGALDRRRWHARVGTRVAA